jgi:hypothetical protein
VAQDRGAAERARHLEAAEAPERAEVLVDPRALLVAGQRLSRLAGGTVESSEPPT